MYSDGGVYLLVVFTMVLSGIMFGLIGYAVGTEDPSKSSKTRIICEYLQADQKDDVCLKDNVVVYTP